MTLLETTTEEHGLYVFDPNLRTEIEKALGKTLGSPITIDDMATLTSLEARFDDIKRFDRA